MCRQMTCTNVHVLNNRINDHKEAGHNQVMEIKKKQQTHKMYRYWDQNQFGLKPR